MTKYRIYLLTEASTSIDVEADDPNEAIELAFEQDLPYAPGFANYEFGEWSLASDVNQYAKPEDDWEELS